MNKSYKEVSIALDELASYYTTLENCFPSETPLGRVGKEGFGDSLQPKSTPLLTKMLDAHLIPYDRAILAMKHNSILRELYYPVWHSRYVLNIKTEKAQAQSLGMSVSTWRNTLNQFLAWVHGFVMRG